MTLHGYSEVLAGDSKDGGKLPLGRHPPQGVRARAQALGEVARWHVGTVDHIGAQVGL